MTIGEPASVRPGMTIGEPASVRYSCSRQAAAATHLLVCWAQPIEQGLVFLGRLMEHAHIDGCCQKVIGGCDGVNVAGQVEVEVLCVAWNSEAKTRWAGGEGRAWNSRKGKLQRKHSVRSAGANCE